MKELLEEIIKGQETYEEGFSTLSIEDCKQVALQFAEHVLQKASEHADADLELISPEAEAAFESRNLEEGVDYEVGVSRKSILDVKLLLQ